MTQQEGSQTDREHIREALGVKREGHLCLSFDAKCDAKMTATREHRQTDRQTDRQTGCAHGDRQDEDTETHASTPYTATRLRSVKENESESVRECV